MKIKILNSLVLVILITVISPVFINTASAACAGSCIDTQECKNKGGISTPGLCSGPTNIQCCVISSGGSQYDIEIPNPLKVTSISSLIDRIVDYVIGIASIILPLVIIFGAYQMLWSGGDLEKIISGRKTITYAIIGFALVLISKGITMIIAELMGGR